MIKNIIGAIVALFSAGVAFEVEKALEVANQIEEFFTNTTVMGVIGGILVFTVVILKLIKSIMKSYYEGEYKIKEKEEEHQASLKTMFEKAKDIAGGNDDVE